MSTILDSYYPHDFKTNQNSEYPNLPSNHFLYGIKSDYIRSLNMAYNPRNWPVLLYLYFREMITPEVKEISPKDVYINIQSSSVPIKNLAAVRMIDINYPEETFVFNKKYSLKRNSYIRLNNYGRAYAKAIYKSICYLTRNDARPYEVHINNIVAQLKLNAEDKEIEGEDIEDEEDTYTEDENENTDN